jgi:5-dehydro-4-deoxyglucarate dehydratase
MSLSTEEITRALADGLLSFPVTDMDENGELALSTFKNRVAWFLEHQVSAVFVAGGTGEFFSLSQEEYQQLAETSAEVVQGKVPLLSSVGRSIPEAIEFARIAEAAGVDALLLMPPYLTEAPQEGVYEYAKTIIRHTNLSVVYYNRSNGVLNSRYIQKLADECPNLIGLKDGTGNMQELNDTIKTVGDRLVYIGGVPTAEIIAEAYVAIGVNTYSSAVFNFVPDLANLFYKNLRAGNKELVARITNEFYIPFVRLRSRNKGYAVSLIKAGAKLIDRSAGDVRSPLTMPTPEEVDQLNKIIQRSRALVSGKA